MQGRRIKGGTARAASRRAAQSGATGRVKPGFALVVPPAGRGLAWSQRDQAHHPGFIGRFDFDASALGFVLAWVVRTV